MRSLLLSLTLGCANAAAPEEWNFDYAQAGNDWHLAQPPSTFSGRNQCGDPENQSPVNLWKPLGPYGYAYGEPIHFEIDNFHENFSDPRPGMEVVWEMLNIRMYLDEFSEEAVESFFISDFCRRVYGCPTNKFKAKELHFHHNSEHAKNGQRAEFEIHVTFDLDLTAEELSASPVKKAAVAIFFDSVNYDPLSAADQQELTIFFDTLNLEKLDSVGSVIDERLSLGALDFTKAMHVFDFSNRWVYLGCSTLPPCTKLVYWNVIQQVYPITTQSKSLQEHAFKVRKSMLGRESNARDLQAFNGQQVFFISGTRVVPMIFAMMGLLAPIIL